MVELKCPNCGQSISLDETSYNSVVQKVRDAEFEKSVSAETKRVQSMLEAKFKSELKSAVTAERSKAAQNVQSLKEELSAAKAKNTDFDERLAHETDSLRRSLEAKHAADLDAVKARAESDAASKITALTEQLATASTEIAKLRGDVQSSAEQKEIAVLQAVSIEREKSAREMQDLQAQVAYYRDMKTRMSTKMIGETLEQHCMVAFNRIRAAAFPNAYFDKDNTVSSSGSKGDFIFRENQDGVELLSIMFEMKNEMDTTATKHKNEDFLKELDKDRREKNCEYAVLVSMLEADSEYYNDGIVDMSYRYPKMYVIRPQFFIPLITILRNTALNAFTARQQLARYQSLNIDVTTFERNMRQFQQNISRNYDLASRQFQTAVDEIDKSIAHLQKVRDSLISSERNIRLLNDKTQDLSIKKLTKDAPSIQKMFEAQSEE